MKTGLMIRMVVIRIADNESGSFKASFGRKTVVVSRRGSAFAQDGRQKVDYTQNWEYRQNGSIFSELKLVVADDGVAPV